MPNNKFINNEGLGCFGVFLWLLLSHALTPLGALILGYFIFKDKETKKWEQVKKIFWVIVIYIIVVLFFVWTMTMGMSSALSTYPH